MSNGKAFAVNLAPSFAPLPHVAAPSLAPAIAAASPVVLGAAAAAGAVFLTRAALAGLDSYARTELAAAATAETRRSDTKAWDDTFAEVMICNARLVRLQEKAGADATPLPAPFVYSGQTREEVDDAYRVLAGAIRAAEERQAELRIAAALARPRRRLAARHRTAPEAVPVRPVAPVSPMPVAGPAAPASSPSASPQPPSDPSDPAPPDLEPLVAAILDEAAGTVSADDYARLAAQADEILSGSAGPSTKTRLDGFYLATQDAVEREARRAAEAAEAARLLVGLAPLLDEPSAMTAYQSTVIEKLRDVAGERREFDADLRADVDDLVVPACRSAVDRATSSTIARELEAMGYDVTTDADAHLAVTRKQWGDTCRVDITIRGGELNADFTSNGTARAELFKEDWVDHVYEVQERTAEHGLANGVVWMTDDPRPPERKAATEARRRRKREEKTMVIDR